MQRMPVTSTFCPTSYPAPQPREYPNHDYSHLHPAYPTSCQHVSCQSSAEELEERRYQQALAAISDYHHRQAEKGAAARRQQQAEASHQRYLASLARDLERQRQQEELLASRLARARRTQQAQARLAAAERQIAVNEFLRQRKDARSVVVSYSHCRIGSNLPSESR